MRNLVVLMVSFNLLSMSAWATREAAITPKKSRATMEANLLKRCNDGVAAACHGYGQSLLMTKKRSDHRKGQFYIRRACTLAYAPACQQHSATVESKVVKETKPKVDAKGRPCNRAELSRSTKFSDDGKQVTEIRKDSLFDQAGVQVGDTLISVNGEPFKDAKQIARILNRGGAVLNVLRNGRETSVMVNCP